MNMAVFSQQFYFFYTVLLISIMSSLFLMMNLVYAGRGRPTGFSLELIHSDFLESKNLTQLERMERAYQQMNALDRRQQQLTAAASSSSSMNSSWVSNNNTTGGSKFVETYHVDRYLVKIGIGSFGRGESMFNYLVFDTGSDLLWLQCLEAENTVPQNYPYFPWRNSSTFKPVDCDDHYLCPTGECYDRFANRPCKYDIEYVDDSGSTGFLAKDTLFINPEPLGKFNNFVFGCGMSQTGFYMGEKAVGIMGFDGGRMSFVSQLGVSKFEYCLLPATTVSTDEGPYTYIRFDSDTNIEAGGQVVHSTPMYIGMGTVYYVTMIGISVGGTQIPYYNDEFKLKSDGTGGCIFDTGNPYSALSTAVFVPLQAYFLEYYEHLTPHPPPPDTLYEICFEYPDSFTDFPEIIFHFEEGADFHIQPSAAFVVFDDIFCFNLLHRAASHESVVVGGIIQGNHRILYDIGQQRLKWTLENCAANP